MSDEGAGWDCVVDASVAIKLFVVEPGTDQADALFGHLSDDPPARFYVPDLLYIECANILWKYVQRFGYDPEDAQRDVGDLVRLPFHSVPMQALVERALELAVAHGSSAYDSAYVALAERLDLPLVTADAALVRRFQESPVNVIALSDVAS